MNQFTKLVRMDVHRATIAVSAADVGDGVSVALLRQNNQHKRGVRQTVALLRGGAVRYLHNLHIV